MRCAAVPDRSGELCGLLPTEGSDEMKKVHPSEITPEHVYLNRRQFMAGLGALVTGAVISACTERRGRPVLDATPPGGTRPLSETSPTTPPQAVAESDELGNSLTPYNSITEYTNFYEFTLSKSGVAGRARNFQTTPWQVEVGGLVRRPRALGLEELLAFDQEERVYRMRCVEGWSMVIPWIGFPLSRLLEEVEPAPEAKFVRFESVYAPDQMPGQRSAVLDWPYVEGLRLDEAQHDLTILATGLYGKPLEPSNGAPIRLVVPWKYGFKSIKSVVKIDLVAEQPVSSWVASSPREYGFYANVNPNVSHPRWSQATERRIGESGRRDTLLFNGYAEEVAHLYEGMDLREFF
jgi:sulfoxide reductase catalytic subunit YedY